MVFSKDELNTPQSQEGENTVWGYHKRYISLNLSAYLIKTFLISLFLVIGILGFLIYFIDTANLLQQAGKGKLSYQKALVMGLLQVPFFLQEILGLLFLFASLLTTWRLSRHSEIIVMRASGLSIWKIILPKVLITLGIGLLISTFGNHLITKLYKTYDTSKNLYLESKDNISYLSKKRIHLRQEEGSKGATYISATVQSAEKALFSDLLFLKTDYSGAPLGYHLAKNGVLKEGHWVLTNLETVDKNGFLREEKELKYPSELTLEKIERSFIDPLYLSLFETPSYIKQLKQSGFSSRPYQLRFHKILSLPFLMVSMVLLAAIFDRTSNRSNNGGFLVIFALVSAILFYFFSDVIYALGLRGTLPILLALWGPPLIVCVSAVLILLHREDG